jgi:hypothetical protein
MKSLGGGMQTFVELLVAAQMSVAAPKRPVDVPTPIFAIQFVYAAYGSLYRNR